MASASETASPGKGRSTLRRLWPWLLVAATTLAAAALDRELRPRWVKSHRPYGGAEWIWDRGSTREVVPRAFYLARDFVLEHEPARAWLSVLADEEYLVYLNGVLVGSNRYRSGAAIDRYEVARRLLAGGNRVIVEVRSGRGTGGMLLWLDDGAGSAPWVVSDGSWRVLRGPRRGLFAGWWRLDAGDGLVETVSEPVRVWGSPALGRWGRPGMGRERPLFPADRVAELRQPASLSRSKEWPVDALPANGRHFQWVLMDFGENRAGYLDLSFAGAGVSPGLVWVGADRPRPEETPADLAVILPPGARAWRDPALRKFRYALVLTTARLEAAERVTIPPEQASALPLAEPEDIGAFGVRPPPRLPPLEAEIRRQLPRGFELSPSP